MLLIDKVRIFDHLLEQHTNEAAYLWSQRAFAVNQVHQPRSFICKQEQRIINHLRGLLIAPGYSWDIALQAAKDGSQGELFVLASLAFRQGDPRKQDEVLILAEENPASFPGLASALAWLPDNNIHPFQPTSSVLIDSNPTAIASSTHTKCSGDQAGSATGIISGTTGSKTQFASYSFDVKAEGEGVVRHMDMTTMNNRNTVGINLGAPTVVSEIDLKAGESESIYTLRFEFIDELGQPVHGLDYKTLPAGQKENLDQADGKSSIYGKTFVCSTEQNESMDCYLVWSKFSASDSEQGQ